jgi:molecular chaperone GrpE (heat shock protein)
MTSPRERAQLQSQLRQGQEALVRDLLPVLDALDRAKIQLSDHARVELREAYLHSRGETPLHLDT